MKDRAITREELKELLEKYRIGKKPLAALLGWGATTVLLYTEAEQIPDNEYTRHLYRLYAYPGEYYSLLETNRDKITAVAYKKSLEAVKAGFRTGKIHEATDYVMAGIKSDGVGELSLVRTEAVLFLAQAVSLGLTGRAIVDEDYQPTRAGMPYRAVEEYFQSCPDMEMEREYLLLDATDKEMLDACRDWLSWYGSRALLKFLEAERYRLCGPPGARKRRTVGHQLMTRCYHEVFEQSKVHKLKDVEGYLTKRMNYIKIHSFTIPKDVV